jgi:hypothetical protein
MRYGAKYGKIRYLISIYIIRGVMHSIVDGRGCCILTDRKIGGIQNTGQPAQFLPADFRAAEQLIRYDLNHGTDIREEKR